MATTTQRSIHELVRRADKDFDFESQHPIVYRFSRNNDKRDKGADSAIYNRPEE